ncbi:3-isopropylmalate dehydrogenase [Brevibacterium casei]|uniref:3-isopropylmalate dehydrogenase n=1 Tax=Brevibacterium casei CIP 102111 TaxID=1255625 RepID=A0A2H1KBV2_9MICO|nr:3-isopropylmalate dehydrogenase [Brevibacterium casei]QPR37868.1 3-isopropylmalate dehydrogenase [Brevibacterium casei]QPR45160.1 3-isopropylmalate dehydrogenase [Brevibacterium casei]SMX97285.1 3-isopropylmalate dehydrogenase [Brevibacterium casei CIP 102111]
MKFSIAVMPGDGIGTEVVPEGLKVLQRAIEVSGEPVELELTDYEVGAKRWHATGETLTDEDLESLRGHDAIFFGACGDPSVPSGVLERGVILKMRFGLGHAVNLRPSKLYAGVESPLAARPEIDFVVVREGTEGSYTGMGGSVRTDTPHEVATEVSVNTWYGVERAVRDAFARAQSRRKKLTYVHKHNVMVHAGHLWRRVVEKVGEEFPKVAVNYEHTDACTIYMVTDPQRYDVIVTDNLFGDILTDLAAAVTGGIGLAASGNLNVEGTAPSLFEPIHGSAPDIAGQQIADPTASILSGALMASHLGLETVAKAIEAAVEADLAERDGTQRTTAEVGDAIAARLG